MRSTVLLGLSFASCLTPFVAAQNAAASVPDDLRAEIRRIVREEVRAALQDLHSGVVTPVAQVVQVEGKPIVVGKSIAVAGGAPTTKLPGSDVQIELNKTLQIAPSKPGTGGQFTFSISRGDKPTACCEGEAKAVAGGCCETSPKAAAGPCCESSPKAAAGACCESAIAVQAGPEACELVIVGEPADAKDEQQAKADKKKAKKAKKKAEKEAEKEAEKQVRKSSN